MKANPAIEPRVGFRFNANKIPAAALIGLVVVLSGAGTVAASQNSLPGETLYSVKLLSEKARVAVALSPQNKADLRFVLAQKRINEAKEFIEKSKMEQLTRQQQESDLSPAINNFNENISGVYGWADNLKKTGNFEDAIQVNSDLKTAARVYQQILEQNFNGDIYEKTSEINKSMIMVDEWKNKAKSEIEDINQKESLGARSTGLESSARNKINAASKKIETIEKIIQKKKNNLDFQAQQLSQQKLQDTKKILENAQQDYNNGNYENAFEKAQDLIRSLSGAKAFLEISPQIDARGVNIFWDKNGNDNGNKNQQNNLENSDNKKKEGRSNFQEQKDNGGKSTDGDESGGDH